MRAKYRLIGKWSCAFHDTDGRYKHIDGPILGRSAGILRPGLGLLDEVDLNQNATAATPAPCCFTSFSLKREKWPLAPCARPHGAISSIRVRAVRDSNPELRGLAVLALVE